VTPRSSGSNVTATPDIDPPAAAPPPRPRLTVVGLGPAGPDHLSGAVAALIGQADVTYLRTARHPAARALTGAVALDHHYEAAGTFEEVYRAIVEELVDAAVRHAPAAVVYAVPGSPLIAERTVELLRTDARVEVTIVPGLSFLDLAWERLAIDPISEGVRLVDAEHFAAQAGGEQGPFLVAQCWSRQLLSDIKLSAPDETDVRRPDVVLLHHLGLDDEQVMAVSWWDMDRTITPDHLTTVYVPALGTPTDSEREMARLEDLVLTLRSRCPWDRAQTHASLMPHLVEESYEVLDALRALAPGDPDGETPPSEEDRFGHLREELGDLLFQIVFHARLAQEAGHFMLADVARGVHDKLVHRHPHVFGDVDATTADQVVSNWEEIKKAEKGRSSVTEGIPAGLPALLLTTKLQRKALSLRPDPSGDAADAPLSGDGGVAEQLIGDLLFDVADLSRRMGIDPEQALRSCALSFRDTIVALETEQSGRGT
jgi:tetrapyrrole methylase family protein/MazG family protein